MQPRTKLNYNIFGGNIGGPVFIPGHYNVDKQRTFFFFNLEERRLIQGSSPNSVQTLAAADYPVAGTNLHYVAPAFAPTTVDQCSVIGDPDFNAKLIAAKLASSGPDARRAFPEPGDPRGSFSTPMRFST